MHSFYRVAPKIMTATKRHRNITNWNVEHGYTGRFDEVAYPLRMFKTGKYSGLFIWLATRNANYQRDCQGTDEGFKITLSMPGEAGRMSKKIYHLPSSESAKIAVKSKLTLTSEGLRNYKPNQRQCFYNSERQLRFFKIYTETNCEIECLSNFTKSECGCVKFSMPSMKFYFLLYFEFEP